MNFRFQNLGAIDNAKVQLAPLTIICGRNNTGKTYLTYAIHVLLSQWRRLIDWKISSEEMIALRKEGSISIDMNKRFVSDWDKIREKASKKWKESLFQALAAPKDRFQSTELSFEFVLDGRWETRSFKKDFRSQEGKPLFSVEKPKDSSVIELVALKGESTMDFPIYALEDFVTQALLEAVLDPFIPSVFTVSTERTGVIAFKEELNLTKNNIVTLLTKMEAGKETQLHPGKLFEAVYRQGYPLPVEDNIQFVNKFGSLENQVGPLFGQHPILGADFEKIAGGLYGTDKDGVTRFVPNGMTTKLQLSEASSAARSLIVFWYWLKTQASSGAMLLIDEPELNLHPENQRAFARLLAKLVNLGVKVLITTHSDTIVREFNTLIMLARPDVQAVRDKFTYSQDEHLKPDDVRLYVANGRGKTKKGHTKKSVQTTLECFEPDPKLGLAADIFDETIIEMGKVQDALRYGVI